MMDIDKLAFFGGNAELLEYIKVIMPYVEIAEVVEVKNGQAVIQFPGDSHPSQKMYKAMKHYNPAVGDRVMLINNIINGGWKP